MTNRFLVFAFEGYYPAGGMGDCVSKHNNHVDAEAACLEAIKKMGKRAGGGHVYDRTNDRTKDTNYRPATKTWDFDGAEWKEGMGP